jgi:hypothetical protein
MCIFKLGLYQASCLFQKSGKISKSELSANWKFFFPEPRVLKIEKNLNSFFSIFFFNFFFKIIFFVYLFGQRTFGTKFVSRLWELITYYLVGKIFENISSDSVRSGRTCSANLCVRSCPVRKLICPPPIYLH